MTATEPPFNILLRPHIAELLDVDDKTVSDYLEDSKPGGPYANDPVPEPKGYLDSRAPDGWVTAEHRRPGLRPFWTHEARDQWLQWRHRHPGRSAARIYRLPRDERTAIAAALVGQHVEVIVSPKRRADDPDRSIHTGTLHAVATPIPHTTTTTDILILHTAGGVLWAPLSAVERLGPATTAAA